MADILIVEDEAPIRVVVGQFLRFEGYSAEAVAHGKEALDYLNQAEKLPELILLDLNMPEMSGWQLLQVLRQDERFKNIPVVVVTAAETEKVRPLAADAVLVKPIEVDQLLTLCVQWCGPPRAQQVPVFKPVY